MHLLKLATRTVLLSLSVIATRTPQAEQDADPETPATVWETIDPLLVVHDPTAGFMEYPQNCVIAGPPDADGDQECERSYPVSEQKYFRRVTYESYLNQRTGPFEDGPGRIAILQGRRYFYYVLPWIGIVYTDIVPYPDSPAPRQIVE